MPAKSDNKNMFSMRFPRTLVIHRELWYRLTEREILGRYRGSLLGIAWSLITPLSMLAVYTFVFSQVFKARWGGIEHTGPLAFAVNLFAGLIVFNMFGECVNRAPGLITSNPNYVKKVIFPLEVLAMVTVGSSIFHALTSLLILLFFTFLAYHSLHLSLFWIPLVWLPLILSSLAISWILSAAGVFLRDIGQIAAVFLNMLMFLSPIFFPSSALPEKWQPILRLNPIASVIEETRNVLVYGHNPSSQYIVFSTFTSIILCEASFRIFVRSKRAFADVI